MSFRCLHEFNLALLAKQCWRILSNPNSLLSQTLKGKYFSQGDILTVRLGSNPNFTWRDLHLAKYVLRDRLR